MLPGDAESICIEDPTNTKVEFVVKCPDRLTRRRGGLDARWANAESPSRNQEL